MVNNLISAAVLIIIGWILIDKVPRWLDIRGFIATLIKIIGVLVIISALLRFV